MGQKGKFLVTSEGRYDLGQYTWDDQLFSDFIVKNKIQKVEDLKDFCDKGYLFDPGESSDHKLIFKRG